MTSDKGTENSKQLVTTELPLAQKIFCVPPRDKKTQKTQWKNGNVFPILMQAHQPLRVRGKIG